MAEPFSAPSGYAPNTRGALCVLPKSVSLLLLKKKKNWGGGGAARAKIKNVVAALTNRLATPMAATTAYAHAHWVGGVVLDEGVVR